MDDKDARILELEHALHEAIWTAEFLDGCLTDPATFQYAYPGQTEQQLTRWRQLAPPPALCVHSRTVDGCRSCAARARRAAVHGGQQ